MVNPTPWDWNGEGDGWVEGNDMCGFVAGGMEGVVEVVTELDEVHQGYVTKYQTLKREIYNRLDKVKHDLCKKLRAKEKEAYIREAKIRALETQLADCRKAHAAAAEAVAATPPRTNMLSSPSPQAAYRPSPTHDDRSGRSRAQLGSQLGSASSANGHSPAALQLPEEQRQQVRVGVVPQDEQVQRSGPPVEATKEAGGEHQAVREEGMRQQQVSDSEPQIKRKETQGVPAPQPVPDLPPSPTIQRRDEGQAELEGAREPPPPPSTRMSQPPPSISHDQTRQSERPQQQQGHVHVEREREQQPRTTARECCVSRPQEHLRDREAHGSAPGAPSAAAEQRYNRQKPTATEPMKPQPPVTQPVPCQRRQQQAASQAPPSAAPQPLLQEAHAQRDAQPATQRQPGLLSTSDFAGQVSGQQHLRQPPSVEHQGERMGPQEGGRGTAMEVVVEQAAQQPVEAGARAQAAEQARRSDNTLKDEEHGVREAAGGKRKRAEAEGAGHQGGGGGGGGGDGGGGGEREQNVAEQQAKRARLEQERARIRAEKRPLRLSINQHGQTSDPDVLWRMAFTDEMTANFAKYMGTTGRSMDNRWKRAIAKVVLDAGGVDGGPISTKHELEAFIRVHFDKHLRPLFSKNKNHVKDLFMLTHLTYYDNPATVRNRLDDITTSDEEEEKRVRQLAQGEQVPSMKEVEKVVNRHTGQPGSSLMHSSIAGGLKPPKASGKGSKTPSLKNKKGGGDTTRYKVVGTAQGAHMPREDPAFGSTRQPRDGSASDLGSRHIGGTASPSSRKQRMHNTRGAFGHPNALARDVNGMDIAGDEADDEQEYVGLLRRGDGRRGVAGIRRGNSAVAAAGEVDVNMGMWEEGDDEGAMAGGGGGGAAGTGAKAGRLRRLPHQSEGLNGPNGLQAIDEDLLPVVPKLPLWLAEFWIWVCKASPHDPKKSKKMGRDERVKDYFDEHFSPADTERIKSTKPSYREATREEAREYVQVAYSFISELCEGSGDEPTPVPEARDVVSALLCANSEIVLEYTKQHSQWDPKDGRECSGYVWALWYLWDFLLRDSVPVPPHDKLRGPTRDRVTKQNAGKRWS